MSRLKGKSRRAFLQHGVVAATTAVAIPYLLPHGLLAAAGRVGANDRVILGFVGTGKRARQLMDQIPAAGKVVSIADCYLKHAEDACQQNKADWKIYQDYRQMFDKEKLDAVFVVTPDHGRALPCIRACQAGLDVYAEKPLTVTIAEGRAIVNAARKYQRVFQVGSQQRTMEVNRFACELVRSGALGKIHTVLSVNHTGPKRYGNDLPEQPIPEGDDWDVWCGPTELRPFNETLQSKWMTWWDYSGGEMTNWGAHGIDQVQWALGTSDTGPVEIWPVTEGRSGKVSMRYANGVEVRLELDKGPRGGAIFIGENGKIEINRNKCTANPPELIKDLPPPAVADIWEGEGWIARPHIQNWLDCVRIREKPNADVEIGHRSISVCHLANIARQLGRHLHWDPQNETFPGDDEANGCLTRPRRKGYELPETV
jgi:predicted dehydrogenase